MSDLISRSELIKRFCINKDGHRIPERDCDNFEVTVSVKDVKTIIKEQPTAYNIDKVIEELYEERTKILLSNDYECEIINYCLDNFDKAIEIVEAGVNNEWFIHWSKIAGN